jgi:hypothetical protein
MLIVVKHGYCTSVYSCMRLFVLENDESPFLYYLLPLYQNIVLSCLFSSTFIRWQ